MTLDEDQRFLLIEGVIAQCDHIGTSLQKIDEDGLGDTKTTGSILTVDDDEIERVAAAQVGQRFEYHLAARPAHNITKKEKTHLESRAA